MSRTPSFSSQRLLPLKMYRKNDIKPDMGYGWRKNDARKGKPYTYKRSPKLPRSPAMRQPEIPTRRSEGLPEEWFSNSPYFQEAFGNSAYDNNITTKLAEAVPKRRLRKKVPSVQLDTRPPVSNLVDVIVPNMQAASTSVCYSTGDEPEVSMAWACQMRDKALLEYREARAEGVAWLWKRAIHRAGGGRTISFMIFRLWANYMKFENGKRNKTLKIVAMMQNRRSLAPFGAWAQYTRESKQLQKEEQLREEALQREEKEKEMAKQQRQIEGLKAKIALLTKKNAELEAKLSQEDSNVRVISNLKTELADANATISNGHEAMEKLFESLELLRKDKIHSLKSKLASMSTKGRTHDFRHVLSDRTKQLLGFPREVGKRGESLPTLPNYEDRFYNGDEEDDPLALVNIYDSDEDDEDEVDFGIQVAKLKAPARISYVDFGIQTAPENLAELIVIDWANHMSKAAAQFSGNKVAQFKTITDFGRSLKNGQQLARIVLSLFDACLEDTSSAEGEERARLERFDVPPLRTVHPYLSLSGNQQVPLLKEIKAVINDPKKLMETLVKLFRQKFTVPGDGVSPTDILNENTDSTFILLAYLMIVSPVSRNSKTTPILFDYSLVLEEMETDWASAKANLMETNKSNGKVILAPNKFVKAASPADAFQINQKIKQLEKLATKIGKLDYGVIEGEKFWEVSSKVVAEKVISELSRKARNPSGFVGRITANSP